MKTMRKVFAILLCAIMVLSMVACGGSKKTEAATTKAASTTAAATTTVAPTTTEKSSEPFTLTILTNRMEGETKEPQDLWFTKYMEYYLRELGYNATVEMTNTNEPDTTLSLLLGTDSLPDLVWAIDLTPSMAVTYGDVEGMILDWTPYLNEETLPNVMKICELEPNALAASTTPNGGIYGLPYITGRGWGQGAGNQPTAESMFWNTNWLKEVGMESPGTMDGVLDVLRAFKEKIKLEDGQEVIPYVAGSRYMEMHIWTGMGYYGSDTKNGFDISLNTNTGSELSLPVMNAKDYTTYVTYMNTMYKEGLMSPDYLTMDRTTGESLLSSGVAGLAGHFTLATWAPETYMDWESVKAFTVGDNKEVVASVSLPYKINRIWASAKTEHIDAILDLMDMLYSPEGSSLYYNGPQKDNDPLGIFNAEGWYIKDGKITNDLVENGTYDAVTSFTGANVFPRTFVANMYDYLIYPYEVSGEKVTLRTENNKDQILNTDYEMTWKVEYKDEDCDGHMRYEKVGKWGDHCTTICLKYAYLSEEDSTRFTDLKTLISEYVDSETAKFITGLREISESEINKFEEELKAMGIEEYLELNKKAYSGYIDGMFN